jgi:hypothetical protein
MLLWPLLAIGAFSLLLWCRTGDLRLYPWAQFFPLLALGLILMLFAPKCTRAFYWIVAAALSLSCWNSMTMQSIPRARRRLSQERPPTGAGSARLLPSVVCK